MRVRFSFDRGGFGVDARHGRVRDARQQMWNPRPPQRSVAYEERGDHPKGHGYGYDQAVLCCGIRFLEVGTLPEYEDAYNDETVSTGIPAAASMIVVGVWMLQDGENLIVGRRVHDVLFKEGTGKRLGGHDIEDSEPARSAI
jgi:hypothetical protein